MNSVAVVGLGKIGLPLAVQYASKGFDVFGVDIIESTVDLVNSGRVPFPGEAQLDERLGQVLTASTFRATTDLGLAVAQSSVVVIVVPLVVRADASPDFAIMDQAAHQVAEALSPGTLVLFETTLPVGTTRNRLAPILEAAKGLTLGVDLFVAFSPERVYSGRIFSDLRRYPKLVGGLDQKSTDLAIAFYQQSLDFDERLDLPRPNGVWDLGSAEGAELAKLAETTYRDINIGFANELARYSDQIGVDVYSVIEACNSQPFSHIHQPGIAVGGHCIPVYPRLYLSTCTSARIPGAARSANEDMPAYAVDLLSVGFRGDLAGQTIMVLGAAYRGGVKETAFSGVFPLVAELTARGAHAVVHDPLYEDAELESLGFVSASLGEHCDGAIVQTDHVEYRSLTFDDLPGVKVVIDGRRVLSPKSFLEHGVRFALLGSGWQR